MNEYIFTVKPGSDFYDDYFRMVAGKQRFHNAALNFFQSRGISPSGRYVLIGRLHLDLLPDEVDRYRDQLTKARDSRGLYVFKAYSEMQRSWHAEVVEIADLSSWCAIHWIAEQYAMWEHDGRIFGYLPKCDSQLPYFAEPINIHQNEDTLYRNKTGWG